MRGAVKVCTPGALFQKLKSVFTNSKRWVVNKSKPSFLLSQRVVAVEMKGRGPTHFMLGRFGSSLMARLRPEGT